MSITLNRQAPTKTKKMYTHTTFNKLYVNKYSFKLDSSLFSIVFLWLLKKDSNNFVAKNSFNT